MCTESPVHSTSDNAFKFPTLASALSCTLPVSAEARLEELKQALDHLITQERACMSACKNLRVQVERKFDACGNARTVACDMQGGFGRVVFENDGSELGVPNDTYTLVVSGPEVNHVEVVSLQGKRKAFKPTSDKAVWRADIRQDANSHVTVYLGAGETQEKLDFHFLSAFKEEKGHTEDGNTPHTNLAKQAQTVHWLAPILENVNMVTFLARSVADADDVCETHCVPTTTTSEVFLPAAELQDELYSLNRKLTRIVNTAERMYDRYVVSHEDGYYNLFAPGGGIITEQSLMRVTTDDAFIQNDLLELQENVSLLQNHVRTLDKQELEFEDGDLTNIAQHLAVSAGAASHVSSLETMLQMRHELLSLLCDSIYGKPKYHEKYALHQVVNRRAQFVTLSCVDAGIRAGARFLSGVPLHNCALDVNMCLYQMRQIMANDAHNDMKLDAREQEACLQKMLAVQSMVSEMEASHANVGNNIYLSDRTKDLASHIDTNNTGVQNLVGALRVQKILNAVTRHSEIPICTGFSHYYRNSAARCLQTKQAVHTLSTEIKKNRMSSMVTSAQAQHVLLQMLDTDLRHRIISPLVHKHVSGAIQATREGKTCVLGEQIVNIFAGDVQLLAKLALGMQSEANKQHVFSFLQDTRIRTGYNQEEKTKLLVNLMFPSV